MAENWNDLSLILCIAIIEITSLSLLICPFLNKNKIITIIRICEIVCAKMCNIRGQ